LSPERLTKVQRDLWNATFPDGIDRSEFTPDQLELWDEFVPAGMTTAFGLWSYGAVCALELGNVPEALTDWLWALGFNPEWRGQYMENMRRKREADRGEQAQ